MAESGAQQHVVQIPPLQIDQPAAVGDPDKNKWKFQFAKKFCNLVAGSMNTWNLAILTGSMVLESRNDLHDFRLYNFFGCMLFSSVAVPDTHILAEKMICLKTCTFLAAVQLVYVIIMFCFEAHNFCGVRWKVITPIMSFACTVVGLFWFEHAVGKNNQVIQSIDESEEVMPQDEVGSLDGKSSKGTSRKLNRTFSRRRQGISESV